MKKILLLFVVTCLCGFALTGCENEKTYHWEFEKNSSQVAEIKIIVTPHGEHFDISTYKIVKEIDISYADEIYDDVNSVTMTRYHGSLGAPGGLCILINFNNGEFDVISHRESKHYKYDENGDIIGYNSWLVSDSDDFYSVITKYIAKE